VAAPSSAAAERGGGFGLSNEFVGHETQEKSKPRPFKAKRVGHTEKLNQSLSVDVLEWYHLSVIPSQKENWGRVADPPGLLIAVRCRTRRTRNQTPDDIVFDRFVQEPAAGDARIDRLEDIHGLPPFAQSSP
jgi:hypothetical protein